MKILEVIDSPVNSQVVANTADRFVTRAQFGDQSIDFTASKDIGKDNSWFVKFNPTDVKSSKWSGSTEFKKTGQGNELQIFSFVKQSMNQLIQQHQPSSIGFTADRSEGNRASLYQRMVDRWSKEHGYAPNTALSQKLNAKYPGQAFFILDRTKLPRTSMPGIPGQDPRLGADLDPKTMMKTSTGLREAFDQPLPYTWVAISERPEPNYNEHHARFTDPLGRRGSVEFISMPKPDGSRVVDVSFSIANSMDRVPAQGSEKRIFSTVVNAIRDYVQRRQPEVITFSAKGDKRSSLYNKLIQSELKRISGYTAGTSPIKGGTDFTLVKNGYNIPKNTGPQLTDPTEPFVPRHGQNKKKLPTLRMPGIPNMDPRLGADLDPKSLMQRNPNQP